MTTDEERDRAVEARREAASLRREWYEAMRAEDEARRLWGGTRAAREDDPSYRAAMRDAGRGGLLR